MAKVKKNKVPVLTPVVVEQVSPTKELERLDKEDEEKFIQDGKSYAAEYDAAQRKYDAVLRTLPTKYSEMTAEDHAMEHAAGEEMTRTQDMIVKKYHRVSEERQLKYIEEKEIILKKMQK